MNAGSARLAGSAGMDCGHEYQVSASAAEQEASVSLKGGVGVHPSNLIRDPNTPEADKS
jgi:hypothetical protein